MYTSASNAAAATITASTASSTVSSFSTITTASASATATTTIVSCERSRLRGVSDWSAYDYVGGLWFCQENRSGSKDVDLLWNARVRLSRDHPEQRSRLRCWPLVTWHLHVRTAHRQVQQRQAYDSQDHHSITFSHHPLSDAFELFFNCNRNRKLHISTTPAIAKSREPVYLQALNQNKIAKQGSISRESTYRQSDGCGVWCLELRRGPPHGVWGRKWIRLGFATQQC